MCKDHGIRRRRRRHGKEQALKADQLAQSNEDSSSNPYAPNEPWMGWCVREDEVPQEPSCWNPLMR